jgi:hypothetical protein
MLPTVGNPKKEILAEMTALARERKLPQNFN